MKNYPTYVSCLLDQIPIRIWWKLFTEQASGSMFYLMSRCNVNFQLALPGGWDWLIFFTIALK